MIITCPNCQTRYKVANDSIGAVGRQVMCAACKTAWLATPDALGSHQVFDDPDPDDDEIAFRADKDQDFTTEQEALADAAMESHGTGQPSETEIQQSAERMQALAKRKLDMTRSLPYARMQRLARWALLLLVAGSLAALVTFRTEIVRMAPSTDAVYRLIGLGTNVIGLDFIDVKTLRTTRNGTDTIVVTATIVNSTNRVVSVPPVLISMIDGQDNVIYQWSVNPSRRNIMPGDGLEIETDLSAPPPDAQNVRLTFIEGHTAPAPAQ